MCPGTAPPARARAGRTASCARHCTLWPLPLPHTGEDVHAADRPHTPRHRVRTLPLWPLVSFPTQGLAQTRDQCEDYYYSFMSKRAQRHGGALRGDKSRVGIKMPKLITSARGQ